MKEYRVRQKVTEGPHKGEWKTAWHPNGGTLIHPFKSLADAKRWIASQPAWYEKYNKAWPPEFHKEVPEYKIEVREVTPWKDVR